MKKQNTLLALALASVASTAAMAHEGGTEIVEELVIYGRAEQTIGQSSAASQGLVGYDDLQLQPLLRVGELVESIPGMVATQHSGTGKANQYFLRGFNLDHGTDFSAHVAGMPINMRTHGHGQGYLDLNFLIPEIVEKAAYRKGPYAADVGDFSSAGTVSFELFESLDERLAEVTIGEHEYFRSLLAGSTVLADGELTAAFDAATYAGPWQLDEDLEQYKATASYAFDLGQSRAQILFMGYDGDWNSTDQIPRRAVTSGLVSSNGFLDPDLGGQTERYSLSASVANEDWAVSGYVIDYDFTLFSNFTYFLDDADAGDQFEQRDARRIYGARLERNTDIEFGDNPVGLRFGAETRYDDIDEVGLHRTSSRVRTSTVRNDAVEELSVAGFVEASMSLTDRLRAVAGLRGDYYDWEVNALRTANSGSGDDTLLSPKFSLAYLFNDRVEGYLNWGQGFHSNDVRGTTISVDPASGDPATPVDALVGSEGAEIGLRFENGERFNTTLVLFWLELDSELVYVGDAGGTEVNDGSERTGFEASTFWRINDVLAMNAAYTYTDAKFKVDSGAGREVPGAVESNFTLGLNAAWTNGVSGSLRARYLGEAPLVEDGSVTTDDSLMINAGVAWRINNIELRLDGFNLLDSDDDDIAYYYASRLAGEPVDGVEDIHFHPLEPRTLRASFLYSW